MLDRIDIKATLKNVGVRKTPIYSGMRPAIRVKQDYLTTGILLCDGTVEYEEEKEVSITFISPKYYANSLWVGKQMKAYDGATLIAYITVTEIINPILDKDAEKWALLDGRKIHTMQQFYEQVQEQMTKGCTFQIGDNLNAFNDVLWGGFCVHEYEEPLHIVWIFSEESREHLGNGFFNMIIDIINNHESGNKYLELYKEHVTE